MKSIIDTGKQAGGAGSQQQQQQQQVGAGGKTVITTVPADVKTKVQLTEHLLKSGYMEGDQDFTDTFTKLGAELPLK